MKYLFVLVTSILFFFPNKEIDLGKGLKAELSSFQRVQPDSIQVKFNECLDWSIKPSQIEGILDVMQEAHITEYMNYCYFYPCYYKLSGTYKGEVCDIEIRSTSSVVIQTELNTYYYIMTHDDPRFIVACDCCE